MSKSKVAINSAFLATKEKSDEKKLIVGKIPIGDETNSLVFYLLEILTPWLPTNKVEDAIVETITKAIRGSFGASDFEESLKDVNLEIANLAQEKEIDWVGNINALIGYAESNKLHLSMFGNIEGYLIRESKISKITEGLSDPNPNPLKLFSSITSGGLSDGDRVLISNLALYDSISIDRSRRLISNLNAREALKEFHSALRKIRASQINIIILQAINVENFGLIDSDPDKYPEFLYLDQAQKTVWDDMKKKAVPILNSMKDSSIRGGKKTGAVIGKLIKNSNDKTKEKYPTKDDASSRIVSGPHGAHKHSDLDVRSYLDNNGGSVKKSRGSGFSAKALIPILQKTWLFLIKKENRRYLYISIMIILVLFGYWKIKANNSNRDRLKNEREAITALADAKDLFNQGKEDIALGRNGGNDKILEAYEKAKLASENSVTRSDAETLLIEIQKKIDELTGAIRYSDLTPTFFVKDNVIASALAGSTIYSITSDGKIFTTDTREKMPTLVASIGQEGGEPTDIAYSESSDLLYILTKDKRVYILNTLSDTIEKANVTQGEDGWHDSVAIAAFSTNLYLLDSNQGEIWRHTKTDGGFSKGGAYLDTRKVSISGAVDFAIDGNIYVLKKDASLAKFTRGAWDSDFSLGSAPSPGSTIDEPAKVVTDSDSSFIYILDKKLNRIIRFEKGGQYSGQFIFDGFNIDNFFVNPRLQLMWLTSGGNVYEVEL